MKKIMMIFWAGIAAVVVAGCASGGAAINTPVGPNPTAAKSDDANGILKVFSAKEKEDTVGFEFPYSERTDYYIYDAQGNEVKGVHNNNQGEYGAVPKGIQLPPGHYKIKALAAVGLGEWVTVPVVVESGKTTEVHLNGQWKSPADAPGNELVYSPSGFPMGWKAAQ
jgi:hypothetical protein